MIIQFTLAERRTGEIERNKTEKNKWERINFVELTLQKKISLADLFFFCVSEKLKRKP